MNEATRLDRPGMVQLDERRLDYMLSHEHGPEKDVPSLFVLHEAADGVDGFAVYKVKHDWPQGWPRSVLTVRDLQATTPQAYADLWRYVLDVDLIERVEAWNRPADEPLLHLLQEPRRLRATVVDNLWVRLVDLAGRPSCPAICGRRASGSRGRRPVLPVERGPVRARGVGGRGHGDARIPGAPADIACTVNEIGGRRTSGGIDVPAAARVPGAWRSWTDGALARADAMFGWDPAPWSPYDY